MKAYKAHVELEPLNGVRIKRVYLAEDVTAALLELEAKLIGTYNKTLITKIINENDRL